MAGEAQQPQAASILSPGRCCTQTQPQPYPEKRTAISQQAINFGWEGSSTTFIHTCEDGNGGTKRQMQSKLCSNTLTNSGHMQIHSTIQTHGAELEGAIPLERAEH
ncbi:hypothetical protein I7I51_06211 [Histoplasma capsulatum]|uniref:Uncharacterized protein n=1 Tax=Ajellomyces capsulatus TaxID=5037 RepID=A0A8A1MHG7_AJECA|nr:hypothetical protein I7I51_06211 [Histoplasma capsulatum]